MWSIFEDFVIDGDLHSFTDRAGINLRGVKAERVWDTFKVHYTRNGRIDMDHFLRLLDVGPDRLEDCRTAAGSAMPRHHLRRLRPPYRGPHLKSLRGSSGHDVP